MCECVCVCVCVVCVCVGYISKGIALYDCDFVHECICNHGGPNSQLLDITLFKQIIDKSKLNYGDVSAVWKGPHDAMFSSTCSDEFSKNVVWLSKFEVNITIVCLR